jgi:hypothetical protein
MRLISLHDDTVRLLERLRIPFDDLTPDGLWGSPYHLVGVTAEQRAVLDSWNLDVNDLTPVMMAGLSGGANGLASEGRSLRRAPEPARESVRPAPAAPSTSGSHTAVMASEPKHHGDPLGDAAGERELVGRAAAAAEVSSATPERAGNGAGGTASPRDEPAKIRVSIGGKYREATVKKGKIVLDGQSYDSTEQATKSVAPAKGDWVFWEYFDAEAGKWRMLDRDWRPGSAT